MSTITPDCQFQASAIQGDADREPPRGEESKGRAEPAQPAGTSRAAQAPARPPAQPTAATAAAASATAPTGASALAHPPRAPLVDESVARALTARAQAALRGAALVIDSDALLALAGEDLRAIKALQHEVEAQRTAITGPLNEALRRVNELFRAPKRYLEEAEATLKRAMVTYTDAREEAARAARQQADAQSRAERERLAAQALEQREAGAAAEAAARRAAQAACAAHEAGQWQAAAAAQAEAKAHLERAARAFDDARSAEHAAQVVCVPAALAPAPTVAGVSARLTFSAEVTDLAALVRAVAAGQAPLECVQANERFLGAQARAVRRTGALFPGVQAVAQRGLAASRSA